MLAVLGCTTTGNIHRFRGRGVRVEFKAGYLDVFEAAKEAAVMHGLSIKEENYEGEYLIAGHGVSMMSWGELVAIYFDPSSDGTRTAVEVLSKARVRTNIFAPKWSQKYLASLRGLIRENQ